jgi:hypothetical protein
MQIAVISTLAGATVHQHVLVQSINTLQLTWAVEIDIFFCKSLLVFNPACVLIRLFRLADRYFRDTDNIITPMDNVWTSSDGDACGGDKVTARVQPL